MTSTIPVLTVPRGLGAISAAAPALFVANAKAAERFFDEKHDRGASLSAMPAV